MSRGFLRRRDQLKPASMLQNLPNQHMLFFSTGLLAKNARCILPEITNVNVKYHEQTAILVTAIVVNLYLSTQSLSFIHLAPVK